MLRRALRSLVVVLTMLVTAYTAQAQIPGEDWTRIALLSFNTTAVACSPNYATDGTVFAGTKGNGVWRSGTMGASWSQCTGTNSFETRTITDLAVAPNYTPTSGIVIAITADARVYQSTDGGANFSQVLSVTGGAQGTCLGISANGNGKAWAGFNPGGLYYTLDSGATWSNDSLAPVYIYDLVPSPINDGSLYVAAISMAGQGPVFKRSGSGAWNNLADFSSSLGPVISLAASRPSTSDQVWAGTAAYGMYLSTNGGSIWTAGCDGSSQNNVPSVLSLAVSHNSNPLLLEGRSDKLFRSTGTPPGAVCTPTTPLFAIQAIAFEPQWDDAAFCHIYVGTRRGLFLKGCAIPGNFDPPKVVDAKAVALANGMHGAFIGSGSQGLFKAEARDLSLPAANRVMVQYDNFPNKLTPDIVAICLDPLYDETATSCGDASILFVAANFTDAPADNGVYKSSDWGNTWSKVVGGAWPMATVSMNDLAISPQYREGTGDTTLYAATDKGLFRWDAGTVNWANVSPEAGTAVYCIGLPPTFSRLGAGNRQTLFVATMNNIYYSTGLGDPPWSATGYYGAACTSISTVTGFAFPGNWGLSGGTQRIFVSNSSTLCGTIDTSLGPPPWTGWDRINDGLPAANIGASGIAAEPDFDEVSSQRRLICATPAGSYWGTFNRSTLQANWLRSSANPALSVTFDVGGTGQYAMAGFQLRGASLSSNGGQTYPTDLTGYNSLPDDVFQTLPNTRNPDILFASSPAMGVFISEDKGGSFRPWNKGGSGGPCALRDAFGLGMVQDRQVAGLDVIWTGTNGTGIKYRVMSYNSGTGVYNLDSSWWRSTSMLTGRFERFTTLGTGQSNRVYAASPSAGTGIYYACPSCWTTWTNASVPGAAAHSVKFGYVPLVSVTPLASGVSTGLQSVAQGNWNYYSITVPSGMGSLQITMTPSAGNPDLYVRRGDLPNLDLWDYRPYLGGLTAETVTVNFPTAGIWYIGVRGWASGTSTYTLVATNSTNPLAPALGAAAFERSAPKPELNPFESAPGPKAPGGSVIWGTILGAVVLGDGSAWETRNGQSPNALTNTNTQTVLQIKDGTVVLGCLGDAFYSPQPDEGLTTWISSTVNFAGTCSYDFRDLYQVDLNPAAPSDMRADCLIAAYGTGVATSGGVWLSGDKGHNWMKISSGFDTSTQKLNSIISDAGELGSPDGTTAYYSSTDGTGVYTRTITLQAYPTVTTLSSSSGDVAGGGSITVTGAGFSNACPTGAGADCPDSSPVVLFGTTEATTSWVSSTELTATVPAHALGSVTVTVRNPDTRQAVTGPTYSYSTCGSPAGTGTITATDLDPYLQSGVGVTWPADCTWNDGDPTGRYYRVLRGGADISGALAYGTTTYTDLTGTAGVSYDYSVKYISGCGSAYFVTSATQSAADQYLVPPEAASTPAAALRWTSGLKTQMTWGATTGATGYKLYKGAGGQIANLPSGAPACVAYQGAGEAVDTRLGTTATLADEPASGHFLWYILAATNGAGEGPLAAGQVVTSSGACVSP